MNDYTELELRSDPAEATLIGALGFHADSMRHVLDAVAPEDFFKPAREDIWRAARTLVADGKPVDPVTVARQLNADGCYNHNTERIIQTEMAVSASVEAATRYAETVTDLAARRELMRTIQRTTQIVAEHTGTASEALAAARAEFDKLGDTEDPSTLNWSQLVDEFETVHAPGGARPAIPSPWWSLDYLTGGFFGSRVYVFGGRPGQGKALDVDTPIPTPSGWTTMGELKSGDTVFGADGSPVRVTHAFDVMQDRPCFEVEFSDGTVIVADADHQWLTDTRASRKSAAERARKAALRTSPLSRDQRHKIVHPAVVTTRQIAETLRVNADQRLNHSVDTCRPLQLLDADLPIPPYTLGVWLGDGTSAAAQYTSNDPEIATYIEAEGLVVEKTSVRMRYKISLPGRRSEINCAACGKLFMPKVGHTKTCSVSCGQRVRGRGLTGPSPCAICHEPTWGVRECRRCWIAHGTVVARLRSMGVLDNKHIPVQYLRGSERQRRDLLAGLLDTDGTVSGAGQAQFCVTNRRLAHDFYELATSLGYRVSSATKSVKGRTEKSSTAYVLSFATSDEVFRLHRKRMLHKERRRTKSDAYSSRRYITDVRPVPTRPVRCISVDSADHLYLAGRSMIPTHNSTAVVNCATYAAMESRKKVLMFSKEMPSVDVTGRILAAGAEVSLGEIAARKLSDDSKERIRDWTKRVGNLPIRINARPCSLNQIKNQARAQHNRSGLDILVVDYLQLVRTETPGRSREQEVAQVSRELKALAMELDCVVLLPAQLNRGSVNRADTRPTMADLRDSGQIEQDADTVILLYRPLDEYGAPTRGIQFIVDKNRHGPTGTVDLNWNGEYGVIFS